VKNQKNYTDRLVALYQSLETSSTEDCVLLLHIALDHPHIFAAAKFSVILIKTLQPLFMEMLEYLLTHQRTYAPLALLRWYAVIQITRSHHSIAAAEFAAYIEVRS